MSKEFSKNIIESWDKFCSNDLEAEKGVQETEPNKKVVRRQDGLIERLEGKTLIAEDNRQLLND